MHITGKITARNGNAHPKVTFKNCAPSRRRVTHINNEHTETAGNLDTIIA